MKRPLAILLLTVACTPETGNETSAGSTGTTEAPTTASPTTGTTEAPTTANPTVGTTEAPTTANPTTDGTTGTTEAPTTANPTFGTTSTTGGPSEACMNYCSEIAANCNGPNAQYAGLESCLGVCATFPPGQEEDVAGNSLACRLYHTGAAAEDAPTHCVHAGPGGAGACGDNCESFCAIATALCPGEHPDLAACQTACAAWPDDEKYDAGDAGGNTLACRLYHLTVAATDDAAAMTHCPHTVADSPPCQ